MADYVARKTDLAAQLDREFASAMLGPSGEPLRVGIGRSLAELMDLRSNGFTAVVTVLCEDAAEDIAPDVDEKIAWTLENAAKPVAGVGSRVRDLDPLIATWIERVATEEARALDGLAKLELGKARDRMQRLEADLGVLIDVLTKKWETMSAENQQLDTAGMEAAGRIQKAIESGLVKGVDTQARIAEFIGSRLEEYFSGMGAAVVEIACQMAIKWGFDEAWVRAVIPNTGRPGAPLFQVVASADGQMAGMDAAQLAKDMPYLTRDVGQAFTDEAKKQFGAIGGYLIKLVELYYKEMVPVLRTQYAVELQAFRDCLPKQGSVLVTLPQTRHDVEAFLSVTGLEELQELYEHAVNGLERWVDAQPTDGMKADARALLDAVKPMFARRFERTSELPRKFVEREKGRFLGSVDAATERALLRDAVWEDAERGIAKLAFSERIRDFREGVLKLSTVCDEQLAKLREQIQILPTEMAEPMLAALDREAPALRRLLGDASTEAARALDDVAPMATPEAVRRDLDRSRLREVLRSG